MQTVTTITLTLVAGADDYASVNKVEESIHAALTVFGRSWPNQFYRSASVVTINEPEPRLAKKGS